MKTCGWQNQTFRSPKQACKMYDVNAVFFFCGKNTCEKMIDCS